MEIVIPANERMIGKIACMVKDFSGPQSPLSKAGV
jgi:hypothetical protein